jgi:hypothetical protein
MSLLFQRYEFATTVRMSLFIVAILTLGVTLLIFVLFGIDLKNVWALATILLVTFIGSLLISNVAFDALSKARAKQYLANTFAKFSDEDLFNLEYMIVQGRPFPIPLDPKLLDTLHLPPSWKNLAWALTNTPWGPIAAQALFQRSQKGRLRYFREVTKRYRGADQTTPQAQRF